MCRCRQSLQQIATLSASTTPTPTTSSSPSPSPTPPALLPLAFAQVLSTSSSSLCKQSEQQQQQTLSTCNQQHRYLYYYHDSYSTTPSPTSTPAIITEQALVHTSSSLASIFPSATLTSTQQFHTPATSPTLSLTPPSSLLLPHQSKFRPSPTDLHTNTQSVLEHCSCGLTFAVEKLVPTLLPKSTVPLAVKEQISEESITTNEEQFQEPPNFTVDSLPAHAHTHYHHSHHHGHSHYYNNKNNNQYQLEPPQTEQEVISQQLQLLQQQQIRAPQEQPTRHDHHHQHLGHAHNCPNSNYSYT